MSDTQPRETRMLAAIVFTDVVGFSKLASQNEGRVYVALQRDMGVMTNLCRAHGGQVLNTMGDGMLMCFASAVDAMTCATEIQQTLYNQSHTLPAAEILHHRIGVHLGDVIMNGDNVFGDGVNVAARLQALAKPDAVCFSHTVYEIVKNKLRLDAKYLGPRQLKNLGEPVRVWQIAPLGEGQARAVADSEVLPAAINEGPTGAKGFKAILLVAASLVLVGGLGFAFMHLKAPEHTLPTTLHPKKQPKVTDPGPAATTGDTTGSTAPVTPRTDAATLTRELEGYKAKYEFDKIVQEIDKDGALVPEYQAKRETYAQLANMMVFINQQLSKTSPSMTFPINVASGEEVRAYASGNQLNLISPTTGTKSTPWPPTPSDFEIVMASLFEHPVDGSTAPVESETWKQLFSSEYSIAVATPAS